MSYDSKIVKVQWFYGDLPPWKSEKAKGQGAIRGRDCIRPKKKRKFRENESRVSNGREGGAGVQRENKNEKVYSHNLEHEMPGGLSLVNFNCGT